MSPEVLELEDPKLLSLSENRELSRELPENRELSRAELRVLSEKLLPRLPLPPPVIGNRESESELDEKEGLLEPAVPEVLVVVKVNEQTRVVADCFQISGFYCHLLVFGYVHIREKSIMYDQIHSGLPCSNNKAG